jgi:hypothetical protein
MRKGDLASAASRMKERREKAKRTQHNPTPISSKYRKYPWARPRATNQKPGWVYVLQMQSIYKIGCTCEFDPMERIKQLNQSLPYPVALVALARSENAGSLEDRLHFKFESKRLKGEWFELKDRDVLAILLTEGFGDPENVISDFKAKQIEEYLEQETFRQQSTGVENG